MKTWKGLAKDKYAWNSVIRNYPTHVSNENKDYSKYDDDNTCDPNHIFQEQFFVLLVSLDHINTCHCIILIFSNADKNKKKHYNQDLLWSLHFTEKKIFSLLAPIKQMSLFAISVENISLRIQGTRLYGIFAPNKGLE